MVNKKKKVVVIKGITKVVKSSRVRIDDIFKSRMQGYAMQGIDY